MLINFFSSIEVLFVIIKWILLLGYWWLITEVTIRILFKRRTVPSAMAWLLIIYVVPFIGAIIYLLLGELNLEKKRIKRSKIIWISALKKIKKLKNYKEIFTTKNSHIARSLFRLCKHRQGIGGVKSEKINILNDPDNVMQSVINDINLAKISIEMIFYIWHPGGWTNYVVEVLIKAANRGVKCRLILDSAGSKNFLKSIQVKIMRKSGIKIVEALNLNILQIFLRRMDLRQHRKMILIDNYIGYTGSMNMIDPKFFKKNRKIGEWIDIMIRMEGPVASAMRIIFSCDWEIETGENIFYAPYDTKKCNIIKKDNNYKTQVIPSGPGVSEGVIHQVLLTAIYSAKKILIMTTPYLVPSDDILHAICTASQRGVSVYIIIPKFIDSILVKWASRSFFSELLHAGVLIYQFEGGLLHTKSILVDDQLSLVGTVNLDMRSLWLNFEITLMVDNRNFGKKLKKIQTNYMSLSKVLHLKEWSKRPYWKRIIERFFYFFSPLL
ncbi:cls [Wigglesworthia glossinidia endosymbiont of Glossina brevipalpis]|uniref:Cardiolipin synthase A n=1 Tax=Wigglesworthia glossinidia brevipalpis TaxID=36870 RepID=CLSA_WIGBR|nr:RecName: Full=Cardiolipin synthase A; Short=CL synthase [Wigglesworthia glossinidia endosymbiont of Glossina brevipalpis]BAC24512.1 cls [Wigglesworthia glossinidia endosymbiont of Glossina brevipalpis]